MVSPFLGNFKLYVNFLTVLNCYFCADAEDRINAKYGLKIF